MNIAPSECGERQPSGSSGRGTGGQLYDCIRKGNGCCCHLVLFEECDIVVESKYRKESTKGVMSKQLHFENVQRKTLISYFHLPQLLKHGFPKQRSAA